MHLRGTLRERERLIERIEDCEKFKVLQFEKDEIVIKEMHTTSGGVRMMAAFLSYG